MPPAKQLSNPFSTGGGGAIFESHVQASFVALMLTRGVCPCFPDLVIEKVKLQGKHAGFETDDFIVFGRSVASSQEKKLLAQIKHRISFTKGDKVFSEVVQAAWSDFNNSKVFTEGSDALALITGPLSATDIHDFRELLEWARSQEEKELFQNIKTAKFSSEAKRRKLHGLIHQLTGANGGQRPSDNQIWRFMKSFHLLGYDLDVKYSSTVALLQSLIGLASKSEVHTVWRAIVSEVQARNVRAGTISLDDLTEELLEIFRIERTPPPPEIPVDSIREMVIANLLGGWSENSVADREAIVTLYGNSFERWQDKVRNLLLQDSNLFSQKDGVWRVRDRKSFWYAIGQRVSDADLDKLHTVIVSILGERDPALDLSPEDRYAANIHGKARKHSTIIRKGVAETLALCGAKGGELATSSSEKPQTVAHQVVREILSENDWETWASLDDVLALLAEAAPEAFLGAIENTLISETGAFGKIFEQETSGFAGRTYMTGVLWGLEALAWSPAYLVQVCRILGDLATVDPGGNWGNRPSNSLTTILLPWLPQTSADSSKRHAAVQGVIKSQPESGWKLLVSLLPEMHSSSSGTHKPKWRSYVPADWKDGVTHGQKWADERFYAELALKNAGVNAQKLEQLIRRYFRLAPEVRDALREHLTSENVLALQANDRYSLWNALATLTSNHRKFADSDNWKVPEKALEDLDEVADQLMPRALEVKHRRLFCETNVELYDGIGNYKEQWERLEQLRRNAIREIYQEGGIKLVYDFAADSSAPWQVGYSLGTQEQVASDDEVLPKQVVSDTECNRRFADGYVLGRFRLGSWDWVDSIDMTNWNGEAKGRFFSFLPFHPEVWTRVEASLGSFESEYWLRARADSFDSEGFDISHALEKLIEFGRPDEALNAMRWLLKEKKLGPEIVLRALESLTADQTLDPVEIGESIRFLQGDNSVDEARLRRVEWKFLPFLGDFRQARPTKLSQALADDPEFFVSVIATVFRSDKEEEASETTNEQVDLARSAYRLLYEWKTPPGTRVDGAFDPGALIDWVAVVKEKCKESGHWDSAANQIGEVLFYSPRDTSGLWLDPVCEILDIPDHDEMRTGFSTQIFNSRGCYTGDGGVSTRRLSEEHDQLASLAEDKGYTRLGVEFRRLAETYKRDARREAAEERVIE
ncbi:MAG: hypothetical protein CMO55_01320 [Verrucomicrobiales bacterium]|nr:hypothetical protein [Verrucomicrobiales bacterium]